MLAMLHHSSLFQQAFSDAWTGVVDSKIACCVLCKECVDAAALHCGQVAGLRTLWTGGRDEERAVVTLPRDSFVDHTIQSVMQATRSCSVRVL